jgi:PAS domain S-box-containing protein
MDDQGKSNEELHQNVIDLRRRLELSETERKQTEEALRQSEKQYRQIFTSMADSLIVGDLEGRIVAANLAACETHGYTHDEIIGLPASQLIHPDDHHKFHQFLEMLQTGSPYRTEIVDLKKDGSAFHAEAFGRLFTYMGKPHLLTSIHDITERKKAEKELRQNNEELQAIYDGMVDGLLVADIETKKFVRTNYTICRMLGYSQEEMLSLSVIDIHPPDDLANVLEKFKALAEGRLAVAENLPVLRKDGSVFDADITANHLDYQGRSCVIGFFRDITERKKAEEELRESEETARALINAPTESFVLLESDGTALILNEAAARRLGGSVQELVGKCVWDLMPPDVAQPRKASTEEVVRSGEPVCFENPHDGRFFQSCIYPVLDASGQAARLAVYSQDITDRKKAENELRQSEETARALINAPTESFSLTEIDGVIVTLNETTARRLGGNVQELVGKCVYDFLPPDVAQSRKNHVEKVIRTGEPISFEYSREGRFLQSCIYPVFIPSGEVARLAVYTQDITDRKKAEEAVLNERDHLRRSLEASDRERRLVSYDIHDGLAQHLTGAMMQFQSFFELQANNAEMASEAFANGMGLLHHALTEARRIIGGVRPPILDEMGVVAAIHHLVADIRTNEGPEMEVAIDFEFDRLGPIMENAVFRIVQESLANACTHSESNKVRLTLAGDDKHLHVEIQDWGIGFDVEKIREDGFGLESMRERARLLGGNAVIDSEPGRGTRVVVRLPLPKEA